MLGATKMKQLVVLGTGGTIAGSGGLAGAPPKARIALLLALNSARSRSPVTQSMQFENLVTLLETHHARFRTIEHPAEGKSDLVAKIRGTTPGQGAKAMLCRSKDDSNRFILAILPGDRKLDFRKVAEAAGLKKVTLAGPEQAAKETGCVIGAIPPFTNSPRIELVVDPALVESHQEIAFNAGRLDRSMVLNSQDYVRIAQPKLHPICS